jgi:dihydroorotase
MKLLLKKVRVVDPASPYNFQVVDIRFENGKLVSIGSLDAEENEEVVEKQGLHISPGWIDMHVDFSDPGFEDRETLETGIAAAMRGGFTGAVVMPGTNPVVDGKSGVEYLFRAVRDFDFQLLPAGAITRSMAGKEMAEMFDMYQSGAVCFTDDMALSSNSEMLKLALQYCSNFGAPIMTYPQDASFIQGAQMHEGEISTLLGMRGVPAFSEAMEMEKQLHILRYAGGHLHFMGVSTLEGVEVLRRAKEEGLSVTADTHVCNLFSTDKDLYRYDTNYKVFPPLRSEEHQKALINAVKTGVIDAVSSNHRACTIEEKDCEFAIARFGMIGLESCFGILGSLDIPLEDIVRSLAIMPRIILDIDPVVIQEGVEADFTLFVPDEQWQFTKNDIQSRSANTPYLGSSLKGRVLGVLIGDLALVSS